MDLVDILAGLGPDNLAEKRKALMQWRINSAMGMLAPTTGTGVEAATRMLPMTGEAWTANDAGNAIQEGQYGKAAMMGLLGLLPLGGMMSAGLRAGATVPKRMGQSGAIAWHGSPHKFDKFSLDKIGTGEGAQAYGHGLYLAEHPEVATQYSKMFDKNQVPATQLQKLRDAAPKGSAEWSHYDDLMKTGIQGSLYKTDIPDEAVARFLDWDKPLSQQAPEVRSALNKTGLFNGSDDTAAFHRWMKKEYPGFADDWGVLNAKQQAGFMQDYVDSTGASFPNTQNMSGEKDAGVKAYQSLQSKYGPQGLADYLRNNGVPGIRYLDGGSRGRTGGELIDVSQKNGQWFSKIRKDGSKISGQIGDVIPQGSMFTTSMPFKTESEARQWAQQQINGGTSNFVAFDPELIRILERNGIPTGNQPWKPGEWQGMLSGTK